MTVITVYVTRLNYSHLYDLCVGSLGSCFYEAHNPNQPKCLFFVVAVNNEQPIMSRAVLNAKGCSSLQPQFCDLFSEYFDSSLTFFHYGS